ncbi:malate:quinone oxidoreductase [Tomitella gaofuii]|uniref:malate:quinone oxidoreductase n=1 Tax=Tomitella gaofuii TaxID=2760083 RepID=UPI0015F8BED6|nr:malate:quinone oxidoreductase [Tomitella gaofuii]
MSTRPQVPTDIDGFEADAVLIGGGIVSATLGSMLAVLQPDWRIVVLEKNTTLASESSDPWNNAGTGHNGFCELNYMPDPGDAAKSADIARQFHEARQWWSHLAEAGRIDPAAFIHAVPHMDVVFGAEDVEYLHRRYKTLRADPLFAGMEYSEDPVVISQWAPLLMERRGSGEPIAATRHPGGTDVDFGDLTRQLADVIADVGGQVCCGHEVRGLRKRDDGGWDVSGATDTGRRFTVTARFVFVGAGGYALRLLQRAGVREVRGYGVLPVGGGFLRCSDPDVADRHDAKVYGRAEIGAPPMSVPHLDTRIVGGTRHVMFGPYATFSTRLLKSGRLTDFFTTLRWHNLLVLIAAILQNLTLVRYLITELASTNRGRMRKLQRLCPGADSAQWEFIHAGQRAQVVAPDKRRFGVLRMGTETIISADGSIAGVLGASPGASTTVSIICDLLRRSFPGQWARGWGSTLAEAIPGSGRDAVWNAEAVRASTGSTARVLRLRSPGER